MMDALRFYIDGSWRDAKGQGRIDLVNPSTEDVIGQVAVATHEEVAEAIAAARRAFDDYSKWTPTQRKALIHRINEGLKARNADIAARISVEMGAPKSLAEGAQAPSGPQHFSEILDVLDRYPFEEWLGTTKIRREPIGVCSLITPWNWPLNQIATKVAPALAAGCTMVLKPSEAAPLDAIALAEIIDEAGAPKGVFNLVHGDGPTTGAAMCSHPDVAMVSFTGSTRAGISISQGAAPGVKRVALELGGKSANIILPDADLSIAIPASVRSMMLNTGQSCNALARLLVSNAQYAEVARLAVETARKLTVGPPESDCDIGPIANGTQYRRVVALIRQGMAEGATLLCGGVDRPSGLEKGYFLQPTVFGDVEPGMLIAREEIFGPVLAIIRYQDEREAVRIANDSEYGLSGGVWSADLSKAVQVAQEIRTGMVHINGAPLDSGAPFGGFKKSGNGREWGKYGLDEFVELKSIYGARTP
jgi:aldehyde dehydrogenase (NAD+)